MKKIKLLSLFALLVITSANAQACEKQLNMTGQDIKAADTNHDNQVTQQEFNTYFKTKAEPCVQEHAKKQFKKFDKDGNNIINSADFHLRPTHQSKPADSGFSKYDLNHDGFISVEEYNRVKSHR